ncbi:GFA family protein [Sphingomonas crocodyli]|uniref:GFA family protein n=2 Tax=Sphingomonas crocodyli TaxID=1979270 RepID=A0A437LV09_9SPHN|nr:GFA family protein [Sphingomonas crocodyli]
MTIARPAPRFTAIRKARRDRAMTMSEGGYLCGKVRYRISAEPTDAGWCHCRNCQLNSGSPAMAFANVPVADFAFIAGDTLVGRYQSSEIGHRAFCTACGTPLYFKAEEEESIAFSIATLDAPETVTPGYHIFYASHIAWAGAADDLPRYAKLRSDGDPL